MDIFQAAMLLDVNKHRPLQHLKAMNKKLAFSVGLKEPRKMGPEMEFNFTNATIANVNLQEVTGFEMKFSG